MSAAEGAVTLSDAIRAYLHWRQTPYPKRDPEAVRELIPDEASAAVLLEAVEGAVRDSEQIELTDEQLTSLTGGEEFRAALAERRPDLDDEAVRALASRIFFNRLH